MKTNVKIVFLFPHLPNPRMIKRINVAKDVGDVSVIYWNRLVNINEGNKIPDNINSIEIKERGNEGKPFKRLGATFRVIKKSFKSLKKFNPNCIHVSKTDMLMVAYLYKVYSKNKCKIIYEVSDMHELMLTNSDKLSHIIVSKLLKFIEKLLCKKVDNIIVTSEYFYSEFYKDFVDETKKIFIPNTPDLDIFNNYEENLNEKFTVGYIGSIRYKKQIELMIKAAKDVDINVLIAGSGKDYEYIKDVCKGKKYIEFYGPYEYEREIVNLYKKVDCIYSVYDYSLQNVRIALPNRLYESARCNKPIIVSKNTELSRIVEEYNIGTAVQYDSLEEIKSALLNLKTNKSEYIEKKNNCNKFIEKFKLQDFNKKLKELYQI